MRTGLNTSGYPDFAIHILTTLNSETDGLDSSCNIALSNVDYGDEDQVEAARAAILRMDVWAELRGWAFRDANSDGLEAISQIILCNRASIWARDNGEMPVAGLSAAEALAAQVALFSRLSPLGLQAMTARQEVVTEGIRYTPDTGSAEADALLRMVVTPQTISALRNLSGGRCEVADVLERHAKPWRRDALLREHAVVLEAESLDYHHSGEFADAAVLMEYAATLWGGTDQSGLSSAHAWVEAANNWRKIRHFDRAVRANLKAAELWAAAGLPGDSAKAYGNAAWCLGRAGKHSLAEETCAKEALAWEAANHAANAAMAWQYGGAPERAAQAWKRALNDAGTKAHAAARIADNGAPHFYVHLDAEGSNT